MVLEINGRGSCMLGMDSTTSTAPISIIDLGLWLILNYLDSLKVNLEAGCGSTELES